MQTTLLNISHGKTKYEPIRNGNSSFSGNCWSGWHSSWNCCLTSSDPGSKLISGTVYVEAASSPRMRGFCMRAPVSSHIPNNAWDGRLIGLWIFSLCAADWRHPGRVEGIWWEFNEISEWWTGLQNTQALWHLNCISSFARQSTWQDWNKKSPISNTWNLNSGPFETYHAHEWPFHWGDSYKY